MQYKRQICALMLATLALSGCTAGRTAFSKGEKLEREGNLDAALVQYAEVATAHPEVAEYRVRFLKASEAAGSAHFRKAETFYLLKNYDDALREYQSAYAIDPTNVQAKLQADLVLKLRNAQTYVMEGSELEKSRKPHEAIVAYRHALEFEPNNKVAREALDRLASAKRHKLDGYELQLKSTKPITLKFKDAKLKEIFNILSQLSGINFVFDEAVKDVNISLFLENATFQQALELITGMNKLDKKVLNQSTIIIFPRTPDKLKQYEDLVVQTFYLNKLDAKKAVNLIRTMLQVKKIYVNEEMNALVIRDTPEAIEVARKILEANDVPDAEVLLEVEVFELSKKDAEAFGVALSRYAVTAAVTTPGGAFFSDTLNTQPTTTATTTTTTGTTTQQPTQTNSLLNLFAYKGYNGWLTVPSATFNFGKTLGNTETLANPKIRVKNREKAKFNVGTRVPITTTSSPSTGGINVNVQYVDVGVKLNAEPTIQISNEVSIKLGLEVSTIVDRATIGTDAATTVVTIGTRNLDTVLSLKDGETSIIGGLIQKNKNDSKQKVWLLGDIPIIGSLFTSTNDSEDKSELLLAITPRIVRGVTVPDADVAAFWSGREEEPSSNKPYSSFSEEEITPEVSSPALAPRSMLPPAAAPTGIAVGRVTAATAGGRRMLTPGAESAVAPAAAPAPAAAEPAPAPAVPAANAAVPAPAVPAPNAAVPAPNAAVPAPNAAVPAPNAAVPAPNAAAPAPNAVVPAPAPPAQIPVPPQPVPQLPVPPPPVPQALAAQPPTAVAAQPATAVAPAAVAPAPAAAPGSGVQQGMTTQPANPTGTSAQGGGNVAPAAAQVKGSPVSLMLSLPSSVQLNSQFAVQVNANGAKDLYNAVFVITYDASKLDIVSQAAGDLLKQNNTNINFQAFPDRQKGELWISEMRTNAPAGASGSGSLATVTFKAIAKGGAPIGFSNTTLSNTSGAQMPVTAFKSVVEVK